MTKGGRGLDIVFRIGGEGGVISFGEILTKAFAACQREVYTFRTYPPEIKGGHAWYQVRVSDELLLSQGDVIDVLVAFDEEAFVRHRDALGSGGVVVYDSGSFQPESGSFVPYGAPFTNIVKESGLLPITRNIVILGLLSQLFEIPKRIVEQMVRWRYRHRSKTVIQANLKALEAGAVYARERLVKQDPFRVGEGERNEPKLVMSGNQAVAFGALAAGCSLYAGYPITPATPIMEWLAVELPKFGGLVVQAEDEMAALGMVIGASYAGARAMTATSGPGFSLMVELLGLATMTEIPVVVFDVQRGGPSTGMPTKTEQSDLNLAVYGAHGDAPRIVLALSSITDAYETTVQAFDLAERFQCPVVVLSDQYLGYRTATVPVPDLSRLQLNGRVQPQLNGAPYVRYAFTPSGLSPMAIPGTPGGQYVATGLEHAENGQPTSDPDNRRRMMAKRMNKISPLADEPGWVKRYGVERPIVGVVSWGSTEGVVREAVARAVSEGFEVAAMHTRLIWPLPVRVLGEFIRQCEHVIVPELNASGQFAALLRAQLSCNVSQLNKVEGLPFKPQEIYERIAEVYPSAAHRHEGVSQRS